jgi:hypothetical protein
MQPDRLVSTICALLISVTAATAQSDTSAPVNIVLQSFPIAVAAGDYELISQVLDLPAGSGVPNHMHGGPVLVFNYSAVAPAQPRQLASTSKLPGNENVSDCNSFLDVLEAAKLQLLNRGKSSAA